MNYAEKWAEAALNVWQREPVVIIGIVDGALGLGVAFGLPVEPVQKAAIDTFLGAVGVALARSQVTPTADPDPKVLAKVIQDTPPVPPIVTATH